MFQSIAFKKCQIAVNLVHAYLYIIPFNAETTFVQGTRIKKIFENHLNPLMLVSIGRVMLSTLR